VNTKRLVSELWFRDEEFAKMIEEMKQMNTVSSKQGAHFTQRCAHSTHGRGLYRAHKKLWVHILKIISGATISRYHTQ
jgi:hypothetical protein